MRDKNKFNNRVRGNPPGADNVVGLTDLMIDRRTLPKILHSFGERKTHTTHAFSLFLHTYVQYTHKFSRLYYIHLCREGRTLLGGTVPSMN